MLVRHPAFGATYGGPPVVAAPAAKPIVIAPVKASTPYGGSVFAPTPAPSASALPYGGPPVMPKPAPILHTTTPAAPITYPVPKPVTATPITPATATKPLTPITNTAPSGGIANPYTSAVTPISTAKSSTLPKSGTVATGQSGSALIATPPVATPSASVIANTPASSASALTSKSIASAVESIPKSYIYLGGAALLALLILRR